MKGLTLKQKRILDFIDSFMASNVMAPTVYEIAEHFKVKTSTVFAHIRALQKKNCLSRCSKARSIKLNKPARKSRQKGSFRAIPFVNPLKNVADTSASLDPSHILYSDSLLPDGKANQKSIFAMRVTGNSLSSKGLIDGDIVIIKKHAETIKPGDIVVLQENGATTLRACRQIDEMNIEFNAADSESTVSMPKTQVPLHGVVIGLQRAF